MSEDLRILVVGSNKNARKVSLEYLRIIGSIDDRHIKTAQAGNGDPVLDVVNSYRPHVVVVDTRVGRQHGYDFCRDLKAKYPDIGVIALFENERYRNRCLGAGADAFIGKSFEMFSDASLEDALRMVLDG